MSDKEVYKSSEESEVYQFQASKTAEQVLQRSAS